MSCRPVSYPKGSIIGWITSHEADSGRAFPARAAAAAAAAVFSADSSPRKAVISLKGMFGGSDWECVFKLLNQASSRFWLFKIVCDLHKSDKMAAKTCLHKHGYLKTKMLMGFFFSVDSGAH